MAGGTDRLESTSSSGAWAIHSSLGYHSPVEFECLANA